MFVLNQLSVTITVLTLKMTAMPHSLHYTSLLSARLDRISLPLIQLPLLLPDWDGHYWSLQSHYWINRTKRGKSQTEQHPHNDNYVVFTFSSIHVSESVMIVNNGYLNYSSLVLDVPDGLFFRCPDHNFVCILHLSHMCYTHTPPISSFLILIPS